MITNSENNNFLFEEKPLLFSTLIRVISIDSPAKTLNCYLHVTATVSHFLKNLFSVGYGFITESHPLKKSRTEKMQISWKRERENA